MRWQGTIRLLAAAWLLAGWALPGAAQEGPRRLPAFPGAEGFGAFTAGGRGGAVYRVTTLADYDEDEPPVPGSLRAAVEAEGPRTIVFRVAGYIALKRPLEIHHPHLTLAAQTAPGEGITLKNYGVEVYASDVILRYLRVRPGDTAHREQDAINVRGRNVIIDHCSVSWSTDEALSVIGAADDVTIQWCLIAESLNRSVHHKGAHGYGSLLTATGDVSIHHTVYALHESRNPRPKDVRLDFRHNLIYGYGNEAGYNGEDVTRMNYVGNVVWPLAHSHDPACGFRIGGRQTRVFVDGNRLGYGPSVRRDEALLCTTRDLRGEDVLAAVTVDVPFPAPSVTPDPAATLPARLLAGAGAVLPARDAVDRRVMELIRDGRGRIIDTQDEVGGWPPLATAAPPPDEDADGMPDPWERLHGLDPRDGTDHAADADADGYTNLEEYLNATDPRDPFPWVPPPVLDPPPGTAFTDSALTVVVRPPEPGWPVHVTLDGREPTAADPRYEAPLRLTGSAHVRAKVVRDGLVTTAAYGAYERLPWLPAVPPPPATAPGLRYAYYETDDWDDGPPPEALTPRDTGRVDTPDLSVARRSHHFGLLFDGYLRVPEDGVYTFFLEDDYHSRLFIDGRLVTSGTAPGQPGGQVALRAGLHRFHLRILQEGGYPASRLRWAGPGFGPAPIPAGVFVHEPERP
ncbi:chitobiase/beta-hexosaminidase C-terminal domain-containing protein [Rhodocaloribacter litoris]|uniref:PA14 domain-containing protein n=1 Tax=Rhodocaloribacter litoris TaxID=2558931 RepID=UPI00141F5332|nr:PA14 domain-containing protein [Rhodocaloribacter litoris]QXD14466.1 chitobiase/beta-hexosaminidase C-terminal domain-containing protein [Rhodocaloribacter litoris]